MAGKGWNRICLETRTIQLAGGTRYLKRCLLGALRSSWHHCGPSAEPAGWGRTGSGRKLPSLFPTSLEMRSLSRASLITVLKPRVIKEPPNVLRGKISGSKPTEEQVEMYSENRVSRAIPAPSKFIENMELICNFKDVTYDMLRDPIFQKAVCAAFPYEKWTKPLEEREAIQLKINFN